VIPQPPDPEVNARSSVRAILRTHGYSRLDYTTDEHGQVYAERWASPDGSEHVAIEWSVTVPPNELEIGTELHIEATGRMTVWEWQRDVRP
jgi:hypothetical protein